MDKIKILGQTYNIIEKDMKNEEVIFGEIEYLTNTIIINKKMQIRLTVGVTQQNAKIPN